MSKDLRRLRLMNEYDQALDALQQEDEEKIQPSIRAILLNTTKNLQDYREWVFIFEGKEYSNLQGGSYKLRVMVGENYPYDPPQVWCLDGFQHFHVFSGGKVCFKLLNKQNWRLGFTILTLVNGIIKMLHSDPQILDPASNTLTRLVQRAPTKYHQPHLKQYNHFLKTQAKRFGNRYEAEIKDFRKQKGLKVLLAHQYQGDENRQ